MERRLVAVFIIPFEGGEDQCVFVIDQESSLNTKAQALMKSVQQKGVTIARTLAVSLSTLQDIYKAHDKAQQPDGKRSKAGTSNQRAFVELVAEAAAQRASDIHIFVRGDVTKVRLRLVQGMVTVREIATEAGHDMIVAAFNMATVSDANYQPYEYQAARINRRAGKSGANAELPEGVEALRLQFNPLDNGGRYLVARILYDDKEDDAERDVDSLGFHPLHVKALRYLRRKPEGAIFFSGPTGSGKSTSLKLALQRLNIEKRNRLNILTIEDPPEYVIKGAAQLPITNVKTESERAAKFTQGISAALRSDPDVVMPGEARDRASIGLVFTAAMTGHQVWTSIHANDALSILDRLRDLGVEDYKVTDGSLIAGLIAQRLVQTVCPKCSIGYEEAVKEGHFQFDPEMPETLARISEGNLDLFRFTSNQGCSHCKHTGYAGRTVVAEVLLPDDGFMELVLQRKKVAAREYWLKNLQGITMLEHGWMKMMQGIMDPRDVQDTVGVLSDLTDERIAAVKQLEK